MLKNNKNEVVINDINSDINNKNKILTNLGTESPYKSNRKSSGNSKSDYEYFWIESNKDSFPS